MIKKIKSYIFIFLILATTTLFRLYYIDKTELAPDECYYWEWSRKLDYCYMDQGPILGFVIYLSTKIFGRSTEFTVRISAVIFTLFTTLVLLLFIKENFKDISISIFAILLINLIPFTSLGQMLMTHDNLQMFFWSLSFYYFSRVLHNILNGKSSIKFWILTGIFCGLNIMSKYTGVLFVLCVIIYLLSNKNLKKYLFKSEFLIFLILTVVICLPAIIWNIKNNFPTFHYLFTSGIVFRPYKTLSMVSILEYVGSQCGLMTPLIFFVYIYSIFKYIKKSTDIQLNWSIINSLSVFIFFLVLSAISTTEANWPAVGYFGAIILIAKFFSTIWDKKFGKVYILFSFIFCFVVNFVVLLDLAKPFLPFNFIGDDKIRGWKILAKEVDKTLNDIRKFNEKIFLLSDYYGIAAKLAFYTQNSEEVYCIDLGRPLRQYSMWSKFDKKIGSNALYVTANKKLNPKLLQIFKNVELQKTVKIPIRQVKNFSSYNEFYVYKCYKLIKTKN